MTFRVDDRISMDAPRVPEVSASARPSSRSHPVLVALVAVIVLVALIVVASRVVETSSARVAASTSTEGRLGAATITFGDAGADGEASRFGLFFDADGLYPGLVTEGCTSIQYVGSVPVTLKMTAAPEGGTGLDAYVDMQLETRRADSCDVARVGPGREVYSGRVSSFWRQHSDYDSGLVIERAVQPGDRIVIDSIVTLVDDNRAGGLTVDLAFVFEARPV